MSDIPHSILLVDDDLEDQGIIADAFREIGVVNGLFFESNGEKALAFMERQFSRQAMPRLIVLDLNMPKMNGTEVLRFLKSDARFKEIPVIIYSTALNMREKTECLNLGAFSYIIKPVSYRESIDRAQLFYDLSTGEISTAGI
jgi:CheY-like chemotaxis protein